MGLDMYLKKKKYVGLNYDHNVDTSKKTQIIINDEVIDYSKLIHLEFEAMYWRKASSIHKFFVDNIQDGNDDCKEYEVSKENIELLLNYCKKDVDYLNSLSTVDSVKQENSFTKEKYTYKIYQDVDESKLNLTTQSGFFFGSTAYDEYYIDSLKKTIENIEKELPDFDKYEYYYQSSW